MNKSQTGNIVYKPCEKIHSYSSWEYAYFEYIKHLQNIIIQTIEQSDFEDDFDLEFIKRNDFLLQFLRFLFINSSKKINREVYDKFDLFRNEEPYSNYFLWFLDRDKDENEIDNNDNKNETDEDETYDENDLLENQIIFTLYDKMKFFIHHNNLFIFENGSALKLFRFFTDLKN